MKQTQCMHMHLRDCVGRSPQTSDCWEDGILPHWQTLTMTLSLRSEFTAAENGYKNHQKPNQALQRKDISIGKASSNLFFDSMLVFQSVIVNPYQSFLILSFCRQFKGRHCFFSSHSVSSSPWAKSSISFIICGATMAALCITAA